MKILIYYYYIFKSNKKKNFYSKNKVFDYKKEVQRINNMIGNNTGKLK